MMERSWGKLPYPRFLEKTRAILYRGDKVLWKGYCIFSYRSKVEIEKDSAYPEVLAVATTSADLREFIDIVHESDIWFCIDIDVIKIPEPDKPRLVQFRFFDVMEIVPSYNPDSSLHHTMLRLRERSRRDAHEFEFCDEPRCFEKDNGCSQTCVKADSL